MSQTPRAAETRAATRRRAPSAEGLGRLHIDPSLIPADLEMKWVRESCLGNPDPDNVQRNMEEGNDWKPTAASEFPSLVPPSLPGAPSENHGIIRRGGMILMQRPKAYGDEDRAAFAQQSAEILASVDRDRRQNTALLDGENFRAMSQDPDENRATIRKGRFADA